MTLRVPAFKSYSHLLLLDQAISRVSALRNPSKSSSIYLCSIPILYFLIIAEETGFIGASLLIMLFILFLYTGLKIASSLKDPFSFYTTTGYVLLTSLQTLINLFVATGLVPTKGLGLPFISYGMSALLCNVAMLGLIINFVYNNDTSLESSF